MAGISEGQWETIKKHYDNKCALCSMGEKYLGGLDKAHWTRAKSKGGTQLIPLCPNCHRRFDKGLLTRGEQRKLGFETEQDYKRAQPKKRTRTTDTWSFLRGG